MDRANNIFIAFAANILLQVKFKGIVNKGKDPWSQITKTGIILKRGESEDHDEKSVTERHMLQDEPQMPRR